MKLKSRNSGSNRKHALLSPSGSKKWIGCAASLLMESFEPNESGQAAINGTAMHTVSEDLLNRYIDEDFKGTAEHYKGVYVLNDGQGPIKAAAKPPKHAVLFNDEFVQMTDRYVDWAKSIIHSAWAVWLEMRVNLSDLLHPGYMVPILGEGGEDTGEEEELETFGTADLVALMKLPSGKFMLIVGDLKTGRHKVKARDNTQLMLYALGVLRRLRRKFDIAEVRLSIFQPYCGGEDSWDISPEGLEIFRKFAAKRAIVALDKYFAGKKKLKASDFRPSVEACQWCRFAEKCSSRSRAAIDYGGATATDADLDDDAPIEITNDDLYQQYLKLDELRAHIANVEKAVFSALSKGEKVGPLKLVKGGRMSRKIEDFQPIADILTAARVPRDRLYKESPIGVPEIEKMLAERPRLWAKVQPYITTSEGGPCVAQADDPRPLWQSATDEDLE